MENQSFVPKYKQIYQDLKCKIQSGEYASGTQLPYERVLCDNYGVERITIRRALDLLVQEDLIDKRAGLGSFVKGVERKHEGNSSTILFIMMNSVNDIRHNVSAFNASLFFATEEICRERGHTLIYVGIQPDDDMDKLIAEHDAKGIFLISTLPVNVVQSVVHSQRPALCLNHLDTRIMSIVPDNNMGAWLAIDYLVKLGHRRIGYIDGLQFSTNATERRDGYKKSLLEHSLELDASLIANGLWTYDSGREAMRTIFERNPGDLCPTAIFAASDMMAIGAMDEIRSRGLSVPNDISVIGFDNIDMSSICSPKLTTVGTNMPAMSEIAVDHLDYLMTKGVSDSDNYTIRLPITLFARDSTKPLKK